ncbi:hypothetical protein ACFYW9_40930 [Streptomyces sp. NPDC002698]|uniref:DUF7739 domain-containing protein n=1 Tax=Streptomyces sp. NPDC002698 TaxID=3364660 RepID=UPI0036875133
MTAIHDTETHVLISHGADFFGEDRITVKALAGIAAQRPYGLLSWPDCKPLLELLNDPGTEPRTFPPEEAAGFAGQLAALAGCSHLKGKAAVAARLLADAAGRASEAGESWEWQIVTA